VISVLDTSAFSAAMRNEPEMVGFLRSLKPGQVAVVPPVVAEIEYGIQRLTPGNRQSLLARRQERLLSTIRLLLRNNSQAASGTRMRPRARA
jgi:predicted nucleic acid-binding protein